MDRKNKLLILFSTLLVLLLYAYIFHPTIVKAKDFFNKEFNAAAYDDQRYKFNQLDSLSKIYASYLRHYQESAKNFDGLLLNKTTQKSDSLNLKILSLKEHFIAQKDTISSQFYEIQYQGNFMSSLQMIQSLEFELPLSKIVHVKMQTKNVGKRTKSLVTYLLVEHLN